VTGGEGVREPVSGPGPAPSSQALSTPGSGARRSHDLWGRGCRSEGAGEPGRSGNKGQGSKGEGGGGLLAECEPPPTSAGPGPHGSGEDRNPVPLPPSGAFTCAQVYVGEGNLINTPPSRLFLYLLISSFP
jgi:hypothetical protein